MACITTARAARGAARGPATPRAPDRSGTAVTGTSSTWPRPSIAREASSQASARERPSCGMVIRLREGMLPRPRRNSRKPGSEGRRVHIRGEPWTTASLAVVADGCSARRPRLARLFLAQRTDHGVEVLAEVLHRLLEVLARVPPRLEVVREEHHRAEHDEQQEQQVVERDGHDDAEQRAKALSHGIRSGLGRSGSSGTGHSRPR